MSRLGRRLPRFGPEPDPLDRIRRAIATIDDHRRSALISAGTTLANQAEVEHECRRQLADLRRAREEISTSLALALAAAQRVAAQPPVSAADDPTAYIATAAGLRLALDSIESAATQMTGALERVHGNIGDARRALRRTREELDVALREQIRQLGEVERAHRRQVLDERRDTRQLDAPADPPPI
ncbi:MAG: hypothetical protein ABI345_08180 [Jatrophihabitans sp.]